MTATNGLDQPKADLASVIFEAWRRLGPNATPQNASGELARAVLDAMGAWSMTEDPRIREIRAVLDEISREQTGDGFYFASKLAQVKTILDNAPPAPRVFLPHDRVPVGTVITGKGGSPFRVPDTYATDGLAGVGVPFVEVFVPSPEEWQAAVNRASAEREEALRADRHAEITEAEASEARDG